MERVTNYWYGRAPYRAVLSQGACDAYTTASQEIEYLRDTGGQISHDRASLRLAILREQYGMDQYGYVTTKPDAMPRRRGDLYIESNLIHMGYGRR